MLSLHNVGVQAEPLGDGVRICCSGLGCLGLRIARGSGGGKGRVHSGVVLCTYTIYCNYAYVFVYLHI